MSECESLVELVKNAKEHSCERGKKIISDDDYGMRRIGFTCTNCMEKFQIGLSAFLTFKSIVEKDSTLSRLATSEGRISLAEDLNE